MISYHNIRFHVLNRHPRMKTKISNHQKCVVYVGRKEWGVICDNHPRFGDESIPLSECRLEGCEVKLINEDSHFAIGVEFDSSSMY